MPSPGAKGASRSAAAASAAKDRNITGNFNKGSQRSKSKSYDGNPVGGPKGKKSSVMRESTWNNLSKGQRLKEHGTTSYVKYKAGKKSTNAGGTSRTNTQMRGK